MLNDNEITKEQLASEAKAAAKALTVLMGSLGAKAVTEGKNSFDKLTKETKSVTDEVTKKLNQELASDDLWQRFHILNKIDEENIKKDEEKLNIEKVVVDGLQIRNIEDPSLNVQLAAVSENVFAFHFIKNPDPITVSYYNALVQ